MTKSLNMYSFLNVVICGQNSYLSLHSSFSFRHKTFLLSLSFSRDITYKTLNHE